MVRRGVALQLAHRCRTSPGAGRGSGIRRGEDFLYWLKLRLRRIKAPGPAAGTPRCGRRWRAVLAHPAAPTLHDELTAEQAVLTTVAGAAWSIGRDSGARTREAPAAAARAPSHGGPLPKLVSHLATTSRSAESPGRLLHGTFASGRAMVDAASPQGRHLPRTCPDVPPTALNSHASEHRRAGTGSTNAAQNGVEDELVMNRSSVRFRQVARLEGPVTCAPRRSGAFCVPGRRERSGLPGTGVTAYPGKRPRKGRRSPPARAGRAPSRLVRMGGACQPWGCYRCDTNEPVGACKRFRANIR